MGVANAFFGTKVILNGDLPEVTAYKARYFINSQNILVI